MRRAVAGLARALRTVAPRATRACLARALRAARAVATRSPRAWRASVALLALLAASAPGIARADADDLVTRPLVLPARTFEARLSLEVDLAQRHPGEPVSIAPDAWYGVTERWTVGVIHSSPSVDRIGAGSSLCVRQSAEIDAGLRGACDRTYRGGGLDARWSWREGALAVAPRARLLIRDVDPWKPAVTLGGLARWTRGRFAITSDPYLRLGLANTDRGNRTALVVPVWLAVQPTCRWLLALHTGVDGDVAVWRDGWHVPIAFAITARATPQLDVTVEAGFPELLGPQNDYKERALIVTVGWRSREAALVRSTPASAAPARGSAGTGAAGSRASRD